MLREYGTEEPELHFYTSDSSFDVDIKITNDDTSNRPIFIAPYEIPEDCFYEGFYEFQSNLNEVVNTIVQPGQTSYLNLGTWTPTTNGPAPYVNIQVQPKYLEAYYLDDDGNPVTSGKESLNSLALTIYDAINPAPYDDNNPGQGVIFTWSGDTLNVVPIPKSIWLPGSTLLLLAYRRRTI